MRLRHITLSLVAAAAVGTLTYATRPMDPIDAARRTIGRSADRAVQHALNTLGSTIDECEFTADLATLATVINHRADLALAVTTCVNEESHSPLHYLECLQEAYDEFIENVEEAYEQHDQRIDLCMKLGGGIYDPDLDEDEFLDGVSHPYMPFLSGATWVYRQQTDEGLEEITVTVTGDTREIDEIDCIVVRDTVTLDGVLVEDTFDWYAQHEDGTVWYMGEIAKNYEDGELVDLEGSWEAGEDGAQPGIQMMGVPIAGTTYRQELLFTEAEDAATVLAIDADVTIGIGQFSNCLVTEDFTPLEPGHVEHKFYAPGIGLILETKPGTDERLELVSFTPGS